MRRTALLLSLLLAGLVGVPRLMTSAEAGSEYRVDAIFDTAKGVVPGQLVKIAGARVGTIDDVSLTRGYKARIEMSVDAGFAPFRSDARCEIQPEALISENFVQCDPGSPKGEPLEAKGDHAPTVPLRSTAVPVNLSDIFKVFSAPVRHRFALALNTLGAGVAARGKDINEILRRASPTLALAREAIGTLNRQRERISAIVTAADRVTTELARRDQQVGSFIEHGARVTTRIAERRTELDEAIRKLPGLLAAAQPALERVDALATEGRPLLGDLRASAPGLTRLLDAIPPTAEAAHPALRELAEATPPARRAIRSLEPLAPTIDRFAREALPTGQLLGDTFVSLRDRGFVESLLSFIYTWTALSARYDSISHVAPVQFGLTQCSEFATVPIEGCTGFGEGEPWFLGNSLVRPLLPELPELADQRGRRAKEKVKERQRGERSGPELPRLGELPLPKDLPRLPLQPEGPRGGSDRESLEDLLELMFK